MHTLLSYPLMIPSGRVTVIPDPDGAWLAGSFVSQECRAADIKRPRAFPTAVEWFANSPVNGVEAVKAFTERHGLLRWNWTHEAQGGGPSDSFYFGVKAFEQSQEEFRKKWAEASTGKVRPVIKWLDDQLGSESKVADVAKREDLWRLSHPRMGLQLTGTGSASPELIANLVVGDLWQALCCELLETLSGVRICKEARCDGRRFFISTRDNKEFCQHACAKRYSNREYMRRRRTRLRTKRKAKSGS